LVVRPVVAGNRVRAPGFRGSRHRGMTIDPGDPRGPESAGRMSVGWVLWSKDMRRMASCRFGAPRA
jgi:hypothetical protein